MTRLAFKPRARRAFTLVEVAMAAVAGSLLLSSMAYTGTEMRKAAVGVYNEVALQNIVKDLNTTLDATVPEKLAEISDASGGKLELTMSQTDGSEIEMGMGSMDFRWREGEDDGSQAGGKLMMSTDGVNWSEAVGIGTRGMHDAAMFAYQSYETSEAKALGSSQLAMTYSPAVRDNLLKLTSKMQKDDMLAMYVQSAYAPRVLKWSWLPGSASTPAGGPTDSDGDGVNDSVDAYPWDPAKTINGTGGLVPVVVKEATIATMPIGTSFDTFEGAASSQKGFASWDGTEGTTPLRQMIAGTGSHPYTNPDPATSGDNSLEIGDYVMGNTGNAVGAEDELVKYAGKTVIVLVWDTFKEKNEPGWSDQDAYRITGFAKIKIATGDLDGSGDKQLMATFLGLCDRDGNLFPVSTGEVGAATTDAPVTVVSSVSASAAPSEAPSSAASAVASAVASAAASVEPSASPSPSVAPSPSPSPATSNDLYPIAVHDSIFSALTAGQSTTELITSDATFRWCIWNNVSGDKAVWADRFTWPGNSETYINPNSAADTHIDEGDSITVTGTAVSHNQTTTPLTNTVNGTDECWVPLFNTVANSKVTVNRFAKCRLSAYSLADPNKVTLTFLGYCKSDGTAE